MEKDGSCFKVKSVFPLYATIDRHGHSMGMRYIEHDTQDEYEKILRPNGPEVSIDFGYNDAERYLKFGQHYHDKFLNSKTKTNMPKAKFQPPVHTNVGSFQYSDDISIQFVKRPYDPFKGHCADNSVVVFAAYETHAFEYSFQQFMHVTPALAEAFHQQAIKDGLLTYAIRQDRKVEAIKAAEVAQRAQEDFDNL